MIVGSGGAAPRPPICACQGPVRSSALSPFGGARGDGGRSSRSDPGRRSSSRTATAPGCAGLVRVDLPARRGAGALGGLSGASTSPTEPAEVRFGDPTLSEQPPGPRFGLSPPGGRPPIRPFPARGAATAPANRLFLDPQVGRASLRRFNSGGQVAKPAPPRDVVGGRGRWRAAGGLDPRAVGPLALAAWSVQRGTFSALSTPNRPFVPKPPKIEGLTRSTRCRPSPRGAPPGEAPTLPPHLERPQ